MNMKYIALVTGASSGIGREFVRQIAAAYPSLDEIWVLARRLPALRELKEELPGKNVRILSLDLSADSDLEVLEGRLKRERPCIRILVNSAGIGGGGRENPFNIDRAYVERVYAINLFAPWQLCKLAAPHMQQSGYGSIINISSMSSINNDPGMAIYASSKAALNHLSSNLAHDYGPMGIRVNCVAPGATRTKALASVLNAEIEARMLSHTPINRLGETSDIAGAVLYFAAPVSGWVSGQTLMVNGGGTQTLD